VLVFLVDVFAAAPAEMSMVGIWMLNAWAIYIVEFFQLLSGTARFSSSDDAEVKRTETFVTKPVSDSAL
jgi:hypothetical protein